MAILNSTECKKISDAYPRLTCCQSEKIVKGTIAFCCTHVGRKLTSYELCNAPHNATHDAYEICLNFSNKKRTIMQETSEKIMQAFNSKKIKREDLHMHDIYDKRICCLGLYIPESNMLALHFITHYVVPYLYYHSYFFANKQYPWEGLPHNRNKAIEKLIADQQDIINSLNGTFPNNNPGRNDMCVCGSKAKYKNCCKSKYDEIRQKKESAQSQIRLLQKYLESAGYDQDKLKKPNS